MTHVRDLTFAELGAETAYAVWRLRQQVFVVEQHSPYPDLDGRDLEPTTRHLLVEEDGAVVGYARVVDDGDTVRVGRVVVEPAARGRGLADALMQVALADERGRAVVLDAQTEVAGWYATYGFEVTGPEFDDEGVLHLPMRRSARGTDPSG
jgi:ElaA protein